MIKKKEIEPVVEEEKFRLTKDKQIIILFLASVVVVIAFLIGSSYFSNSGSSEILNQCSDDTFYETCSLNKPFYCSDDFFVEKASLCGCPDFMIKQGDSCTSNYETGSKDLELNYVLRGEAGVINYEIYSGVANYLSQKQKNIFYSAGEEVSRADFKLMNINDEIQREYVLPLVYEIENSAGTKEDAVRIAVSLVQKIPFGQSEKIVNFGGAQTNYSRDSYEVLYENQGICGEKTELLAFMLREMGYGLIVFYFPLENHEALGIKCPVQYSFEGTGYCFVESSGSSIISDDELDYVGVGKLSRDNYQIFLLSEGNALDEKMYEYSDAIALQKVRGQESNNRYQSLKEKYGLEVEYYSSS